MPELNIISNAILTMTTREIALLTAKDHRHILADARVMLESLGIDCAGFSAQYKDASGKSNPMFVLPKRETLILVSGYSVAMRAKIIDRWQELEAQMAQPVAALPKTFAAALRLAAEQQEQIEAQQAQLALAAPKVAFVERYVESTGLKGFREVCKLLGANEARFREFLIDSRIMYRLGSSLTAYAPHLDAGRFEVRAGTSEANGHAFNACKFTPKGIEWVAGEWAKHNVRQEVAA